MRNSIIWSGRSHNYTSKDIKYLTNVIKFADPLTQGFYLKKFENQFSKYIGKKNTFAVSSAAAALEIIAFKNLYMALLSSFLFLISIT